MFPLRTGIGSVNRPSNNQVLYQSLTASAMHEIGKQAILDTSVLMFHQMAADVYYRQDMGETIEEDSDGQYILHDDKEKEALRKNLINVVMKYHILSPDGMGAKLTPLIYHLQIQQPLPSHLATDSFLQAVINNHQRFSNALFNQDIGKTLEDIIDFSAFDNLTDSQSKDLLMASYNDSKPDVDVAIYADGSVQCVCEYCEEFFQILESIDSIDRDRLNPIQQIMAENYNF